MSVYVIQNTQHLIISNPGQIFENHVNQAANPLSSINMEDEMIDVAVDEGNNERLLAAEIIDGCKCENTKTQYRLKVEHFKRRVELKHSLYISADCNVLLHLVDKTILKEFLGHKCKKKRQERTVSRSCCISCLSACQRLQVGYPGLLLEYGCQCI
jgi:hypothetical protein